MSSAAPPPSSRSPSPSPSPSPSSARAMRIFAALTVFLLLVLGVVIAQRIGLVGGTPIDEQVKSKVGRGYPTVKPNPKNLKAYASGDDPSIDEDTIGPSRFHIIDIHEHVQNEAEAVRLLAAMDRLGVQRTCLQAASIYTYTLNPKYGFEQFKENNEEILRIKAKWPDRFCAFITIDPVEPGNLERVQDYVRRGADGVKLFLGHGASTGKGPFHVMPIDDPRMEPVFAWAESVQLPVLMHVNLIKYWDETISLLEKHPYLRLCIPHFGLHKNTGERLARLAWIFDRYPFTFTDVSYGFYTFQIEGFENLAKWRSRSQAFFEKYAGRMMFASDMVLEATKTEEYITKTMRSYRQFHEEDTFRLFLVPSLPMHGMKMSDDALARMYERAPRAFLLLDDAGHLPDRSTLAAVNVARPPLAPLDLESIPDDPQYVPRPSTEGKAYGASATLQRALAKQGGESGNGAAPDAESRAGDRGATTGGGNGEGPEGHAGVDDEAAADAAAEHECH